MAPFQSILETFLGPTLIADIVKAQQAKGLRASGDSARSLEFTVNDLGDIVRFQITGAFYWKYQENGSPATDPNGKPSREFVEIIANWILNKRLSISLKAAYPIALKKIREGTQVPNQWNPGGVLSEPLNLDRVINLLTPKLMADYVSYIGSEIFG